MSTVTIVLLVILVVLIGVLVALYFFGKKTQKKQEEQQAQIEASKQTVSMLVIDKKKLRITESGLPQAVIDKTPKIAKLTKVPIVKAKVGPRIMTFIAETGVYDMIPVKKEVKATVSGLYITQVKGLRGPIEVPKKKTFRQKLMDRASEYRKDSKKNKGNTKDDKKKK